MLPKAILHHLDHCILLLRRHLIVTGQAQPPVEKIHSHIQRFAVFSHSATLYVCVGLCPAVSLTGDESVHPVNRLHMHGFPDGAAFRIVLLQHLQDLSRTAFPRFTDIQRFLLSPHLAAHGLRFDQHTGKPEVWFAVFFIIRIHLHRQILQTFFVSFIDIFFLCDVFFQVRELSPHHPGNHVAHPVVVTQFLMLIPGSIFPGLGRPFPYLVGSLPIIGQQHAAGRTGDDLISVKGNGVISAKGTGLSSFISGSQRFRRVLDEDGAVTVADIPDSFDLARRPVEMGEYHHLHLRIYFESLFQCFRIHIPGVVLRIDEHRHAALVDHRVHCSVKGHIGTEYFISRLYLRQLHRHMKSSRAGRQRHPMAAAGFFAGQPFRFFDIFSYRGHPVGFVGFFYVVQFRPVHRRRAEPDLLFKSFDCHFFFLPFVYFPTKKSPSPGLFSFLLYALRHDLQTHLHRLGAAEQFQFQPGLPPVAVDFPDAAFLSLQRAGSDADHRVFDHALGHRHQLLFSPEFQEKGFLFLCKGNDLPSGAD